MKKLRDILKQANWDSGVARPFPGKYPTKILVRVEFWEGKPFRYVGKPNGVVLKSAVRWLTKERQQHVKDIVVAEFDRGGMFIGHHATWPKPKLASRREVSRFVAQNGVPREEIRRRKYLSVQIIPGYPNLLHANAKLMAYYHPWDAASLGVFVFDRWFRVVKLWNRNRTKIHRVYCPMKRLEAEQADAFRTMQAKLGVDIGEVAR